MNPGRHVTLVSGRRIRLKHKLGQGGQATLYEATERGAPETGVLKVFHDKFANRDTIRRIEFIEAQDFSKSCPALQAPIDHLAEPVAHFTPVAPGSELGEFLVGASVSFMDLLTIAIALAHAVDVMHKRGIAYGDLHSDNILVHQCGDHHEIHLIDFDNFNAESHSGIPLPPAVGQLWYMAPELRSLWLQKKNACPDVKSDRFALAVLLSEILLLRHPGHAWFDDASGKFHDIMMSDFWPEDPAMPFWKKPSAGYPIHVLSAEIQQLFRRAFSLDRGTRPTASKWRDVLAGCLKQIFPCPRCGGPVVVDAAKKICPFCHRSYPPLQIVVGTTCIPLHRTVTRLGRSDLNGSSRVSRRHATIRRVGPDTLLESCGSNGTYRLVGERAIRLPDHRPLPIRPGDRLRFADVEATVDHL